MNDTAGRQAAPGNVTETLERLDAISGTLPKRLAQCADFTRRHLHLIAISTVSGMAHKAGVAPSVYMRFCQALGFSGYSEMQALFRAQYTAFRPARDARQAMSRPEVALDAGQLLSEFAEAGHKSLMSLANRAMSETLDHVVSDMAAAPLIHLVGLRRAFAVVSHMSFLLGRLDVPSMLHSDVGKLGGLSAVRPGEVVFAATYAPFSAEVVGFCREARARGARIHALTDSEDCPIAGFAEAVLMVQEGETAGVRSLAASITLATALVVAIGARRDRD